MLIALSLDFACTLKKEQIVENASDESSLVATAPVETPTKFGSADEVIIKINNEMGLGSLLNWQNDAESGEEPNYFTTLEYEIQSPKESLVNSNNVIELSLGSGGATGKYVEFIRITVGFMNPDDKSNAKKIFVQKVNQLSKVLSIPIPSEIQNAIKTEQNLKLDTDKFDFEVEIYGATRKWMTLHIR